MKGLNDIFEKAKYSTAQKAKIKRVMDEFEAGSLKTPEGKVVTDHEQAVAIAIAESDNFFKANFTESERKKLTKKKLALPDGSFPIRNKKDLENAIHDVGRATNPEEAKTWIKKRAKELNAENLLPEEWIEKSFSMSKDVENINQDIQDSSSYTGYADVIAFNSKGELLLLQRNSFTTFEPNKWGLPGGHIEDESPIDAAAREFTEETGIKLLDEDLSPCATIIMPDHKCKIFYFMKFIADDGCDIVLNSQEHKNYEWINTKNIDDYVLIMNLREVLDLLNIIPGHPEMTRQIIMYNDVEEIKKANVADALIQSCDFIMDKDSGKIWDRKATSDDALLINKAFLIESEGSTVAKNLVYKINGSFNKAWGGFDYRTGLNKGTKEHTLATNVLNHKDLRDDAGEGSEDYTKHEQNMTQAIKEYHQHNVDNSKIEPETSKRLIGQSTGMSAAKVGKFLE